MIAKIFAMKSFLKFLYCPPLSIGKNDFLDTIKICFEVVNLVLLKEVNGYSFMDIAKVPNLERSWPLKVFLEIQVVVLERKISGEK